MIQIAYVSSTRGLLTAAGIAELLVGSRERNLARQITGMLLYKGGNVLQVIEGEEPQISSLFRSISKDPRHTGVIRLYQKNIESRDFPDWTMGFHDLDAERGCHAFTFYQCRPARQEVRAERRLIRRE